MCINKWDTTVNTTGILRTGICEQKKRTGIESQVLVKDYEHFRSSCTT